MKRFLLVIAAIAAVATAAVWFAAEESYVTTVKARVGTGLNVSSHGSQNYGLVFGQEVRVGSMNVAINAKAKADGNLTGVNFSVACTDERFGANDNASTICPYLTIQGKGNQTLTVCDDLNGITAAGNGLPEPCTTQSQKIQWTFVAPDCIDAAQKKINPITVPCSQDKNWTLAGAISIDVTGYKGFAQDAICNKKGNILVDGQTGEPKLVDDEVVACVVEGPGAD